MTALPARVPPVAGPRERRHGRLVLAIFVLEAVLYVAGIALTLLAGVTLTGSTYLGLSMFAFPVVGVVIAYRRPGNRVAWLCLAVGLAWALELSLWGVVFIGLAHPGTVPWPEMIAVFASPLWVPGVFMVPTYVLMYFPDGRLPSPRWRWLPWFVGAVLVVAYAQGLLEPSTYSYGRPAIDNPLAEILGVSMRGGALFPFLFTGVIGSVVSVVVRYRRAVGVERQQLKWLATAGVIAGVLAMIPNILVDFLGQGQAVAAMSSFLLIPLAVGTAVVRYRLYDIDRILSRTVTYAVVIACLAAVYVAAVLLLGNLLPREGDLAVAASTLLAAGLFNPLRRRVQARVDRRFHRTRYEAQRVVGSFERTLHDQVDAGRVVDGWIGAVAETVHPATAGVWIREPRP